MKFKTIALTALLSIAATAAYSAPKCSKAELFAGNPEYTEPMDRASEGQGLLDNPPLGWRTLLFADDKLVTAVGQEIWFTDLKAEKPIVKRLAGKENRSGQSLKGGAGRDARFANISGLALLPDGSIVGADQTGNDLFLVKDPFGPGCSVSQVAGTTKAMDSVSPGDPPNVGDVDGPGSSARFKLPEWPAAIGDSVYFIDSGALKIKRMSSDSAHTIKTIGKLPEGVYYAMISLKDKLYALGNNTTSEGFILEIDAASGAVREVVKGRSDAFEGSGPINVSGLATDGQGLFTTQSGRLLYVTLDGKVTALAGTGDYFEFRPGYDPKKSQTADSVQLVSTRRIQTAGSNVFLGFRDDAIYFGAAGTTAYIERLFCK